MSDANACLGMPPRSTPPTHTWVLGTCICKHHSHIHTHTHTRIRTHTSMSDANATRIPPRLSITTHPTKRSGNGRQASLRPSILIIEASLESSHHFLTILEAILSPTKPKGCPWSNQTSEGAGFACFLPYHRDARENHS